MSGTERTDDPIKAEAESIVETFNDAKPDHAPKLSWFGMTALRYGDEVREAFVFDSGEYLDPDGWAALREQGREIEYVETYEKCDGTPQVSIVVAVEGADTDCPESEVD